MAGMLPGVELARRRRSNHHHLHLFDGKSRESSHFHHLHSHQQHRIDSSTTMDETALKARKRLEEKLRGRRVSKPQMSANNERRTSTRTTTTITGVVSEQEAERGGNSGERVGEVVLGRWFKQMERRNSHRDEVCSICLEEFGTSQQIMNLPCSHRYHSDCLVPWLTSHSHCPYCRTNVQP